ncbi:hypothetical protein AUJ14_00340 [Candidatus Micrarchaeota archaeon CG1_02_55_22]|nr:MAG: hypothetical protein AUJ14_00340 [Candidatus Micrarchaeota archaeon CG1_02_55_22]
MERSAGIIVASPAKKFLVLHYAEGHWSFAKGHVEDGESDLDAAKRELKEETGINAASLEMVEGFTAETIYWYTGNGRHAPKGVRRQKQVVFFLARVKAETPIITSDEHRTGEWLELKDALERLTYEKDREILKQAAQALT